MVVEKLALQYTYFYLTSVYIVSCVYNNTIRIVYLPLCYPTRQIYYVQVYALSILLVTCMAWFGASLSSRMCAYNMTLIQHLHGHNIQFGRG